MIGSYSFFSGKNSTYGARARNVVSMVYINKEEFLNAIKDYSDDFEKFIMMKDNLNIYSVSVGLGINCKMCGKFNH
jgi:hypothetical protein